MLQKTINTESLDILNLHFVFLQNQKYFLLKTDQESSKYFTIPSFINVQKLENKIVFSLNNKQLFPLDSYVSSFISWLKLFNKKIKKKLLLKGLGFRSYLSDDKSKICFKIGYSHIIDLTIPKKISSIVIEKNYLIVESFDKVILGNFCKRIKELKPVDVYKNKGFSYKKEILLLKPIKKK
jgi:ribosomal protein L6P/L9E